MSRRTEDALLFGCCAAAVASMVLSECMLPLWALCAITGAAGLGVGFYAWRRAQ
jgi:hypothetical protein